MLKDLFDGTCRIAPLHMEWKTLELLNDPMEKAELIVEDSVTWERASDCLRVICTRKAGFLPECSFSVTVSYVVEHILQKVDTLNDVSDEEIDKEVHEHLGFYILENQGLMSRVSLIISQMSSAFGAPPLVLPPSYQMKS